MDNASLTISLAMVAGVLAQSLASHLRLPGIVLLLAVGVILGPDVSNLVRPEAMGTGLNAFVGFAVAIILFEGGMQMNLKKLRRQAVPIRRLVTVGALVTAIGGGLAARLAMGWPWDISFLFGTLVIVTGPTVITPLLHRFHIKKNTAIVLEAEGIFIDAVGATVAVVALDVVMIGTTASAAVGILDVVWRIGVGALVGVSAGAFLATLIRWRNVIPAGLENTLSLAVAIASFQIANGLVHESGITAAIAAGMVISNTRSHAFEEIVEFKEQLTSFSIATLFVLLAADVRVQSVIDVAEEGLIVVGLLMFVVRPLSVLASTWRTEITWQQKVFFSWLAPRGIVAAAVASLFAVELARNGLVFGTDMRALVFLVIACTVTLQGLTGGLLAKLLGLARPKDHGYLILGANILARRIAKELQDCGEPVVLMDSSEDECTAAEKEGLSVIYGNGLEERSMIRGLVDSRKATLALTPNEHVNFLYAKRVYKHFRGAHIMVGLETTSGGVTAKMVDQLPASILFGAERPLGLWIRAMLGKSLVEERWELSFPGESVNKAPVNAILPLIAKRGNKAIVIENKQSLQKNDVVLLLIRREQREVAYAWLRDAGFVPTNESADAGTAAAPEVAGQ